MEPSETDGSRQPRAGVIEACRLVMITWEDSRQADGRWQRLAGFDPPPVVKCVTVGFLLHDGDVKVLAQSLGDIDDEDGTQAAGIKVIPSRCVIAAEPLIEEEPEEIRQAAE